LTFQKLAFQKLAFQRQMPPNFALIQTSSAFFGQKLWSRLPHSSHRIGVEHSWRTSQRFNIKSTGSFTSLASSTVATMESLDAPQVTHTHAPHPTWTPMG
jgi:hypothetical protein